MKSKKIDFQKPKPYDKCRLYRYGDKFDLETQITKRNHKICNYRKLNRNEVVNIATGEIIRCKHMSKKQEKLLFKTFKHTQRIILANHFGKLGEILIILEYEKEPKSSYKDVKGFVAKLERRIKQKLEYILVLQYDCSDLPRYEMWTSIAEAGTPIDIIQDIVEKCWTLGKVTIIPLTPSNIEKLSSYYIPKQNHTILSSFPAYAKIYRTSKGIKKVIPEEIEYEKAESIVNGCNQTFASTKELVIDENGKEKTIGKISYETYTKPKNIENQIVPEETEQPKINDTS